jgi:hypothetical protein
VQKTTRFSEFLKFNLFNPFQSYLSLQKVPSQLCIKSQQNSEPSRATRLGWRLGRVTAHAQADSSSQKLGTLHRQLAKPSEVPGGPLVDRVSFGLFALLSSRPNLTWTRLVYLSNGLRMSQRHPSPGNPPGLELP